MAPHEPLADGAAGTADCRTVQLAIRDKPVPNCQLYDAHCFALYSMCWRSLVTHPGKWCAPFQSWYVSDQHTAGARAVTGLGCQELRALESHITGQVP
jgi:hypothetical protein